MDIDLISLRLCFVGVNRSPIPSEMVKRANKGPRVHFHAITQHHYNKDNQRVETLEQQGCAKPAAQPVKPEPLSFISHYATLMQ